MSFHLGPSGTISGKRAFTPRLFLVITQVLPEWVPDFLWFSGFSVRWIESFSHLWQKESLQCFTRRCACYSFCQCLELHFLHMSSLFPLLTHLKHTDHIALIIELLGKVPRKLIVAGKYSKEFFTKKGKINVCSQTLRGQKCLKLRGKYNRVHVLNTSRRMILPCEL